MSWRSSPATCCTTAGSITLGTVYLFLHQTPPPPPSSQITPQIRTSTGGNRPGAHQGFSRGRPGRAGRPQRDAGGSFITDPVLQHLSLRLAPGQVLGLLGRTGSGKTTVTRLLLRLYDPTGGRITPGRRDMRDAQLAALRRHVGMVTQDVQLFQATVRDNLTFFDRTIPEASIWEALEALGLVEWCRALPQGLDTTIEGGGGGLSAGEAQLLAFTRVFLKTPAW